MENVMKLSEQISVGPQPAEAELEGLKQRGFQTVVNLRTADEQDQPLSPEQEGQRVRDLGLQYVHFPVSTEQMTPEQVDEFRGKLTSLPAPVFVHCKSGKRSGAFCMMHLAVQQGLSGQQTLENAKQMGFECDKPELVQFVKEYVDAHASQ